MRPPDCRNRGFETRWGHGCSSLAFVLCSAGSGLCDRLITSSDDSYRLCACESNFMWPRNFKTRGGIKARVGLLLHRNKNTNWNSVSCPLVQRGFTTSLITILIPSWSQHNTHTSVSLCTTLVFWKSLPILLVHSITIVTHRNSYTIYDCVSLLL